MIIPLTIGITVYVVVACFFGFIFYRHGDEFGLDDWFKPVLPLFAIAWPVIFLIYFLTKNKII